MRKKIFIIHGKGMVDGIGMEGGGDLDTVGSNAFYAAWAKHSIKAETGSEAVYGRDFAFDFVNYSEGLGHLVAHRGCDVYIPDFPIDALAPRMVFEALADPRVATLRNSIAASGALARVAVKAAAASMDQMAKETFNDVVKRVANLRKLTDLPALNAASSLTSAVLCALVPGFSKALDDAAKDRGGSADRTKPHRTLTLDDIVGPGFAESKADLTYLADRIESFLAEKVTPVDPGEKVLAETLTKPLRRATFMIRKAENLHGLLLEAVVIPSSLQGLRPLLEARAVAQDQAGGPSAEGSGIGGASARSPGMTEMELLSESVTKALERAGLPLPPAEPPLGTADGEGTDPKLSPESGAPSRNLGTFQVHLAEEASGRPVAGVRVSFAAVRGSGIELVSQSTGKTAAFVEVETDLQGVASVAWKTGSPKSSDPAGPTMVSGNPDAGAVAVVTFDEINFAALPPGARPAADPTAEMAAAMNGAGIRSISGTTAAGSGGEPSATESGMADGADGLDADGADDDADAPRLGGEGDGEAPPTDRATSLSVKIIERDIRELAGADVRIVRMDDHHPWTPAIHSMLTGLHREGLIEKFVIHAFERGREMPKDQAKCGADLIHEAMLEGTAWDNDGLRELKRLAHVQDLHIIEDPLSIELSKLIGSGFPKVEMALGLSEVDSMESMQGLMETRGWKERVRHYEGGLEEVLPRLFRTMAHVTLEIPSGWEPEGEGHGGDHEKPGPGGQETSKHGTFPKDSGAVEKGPRTIKVLMILAPFTDRKAGEAKINVASAINFLRDKVELDFLFYCYGSMLMTTRKVSEALSPVDLSLLSQHVGTRADGGHAEAATCKPGSNPGFPKALFTKLDDWNFLEYASYIGTRAAERFGLRLVSVDPVRAPFYEEGMERLMPRLLTGVFQMRLAVASPGRPPAETLVVAAMAPRASAVDKETQPTLGAAAKCLDEAGFLHGAALFAYCRGGSKIAFRLLDPAKDPKSAMTSKPDAAAGPHGQGAGPLPVTGSAIDLGALAEALGNPREAASKFSLCVKPSLAPGYRENLFPTMGPDLFPEYLEFLGAGISKIGGCTIKAIEPARPPDAVMRTPEVGKLVDWCTKRMAVLNILRAPASGDWESGIRQPWRLLAPLARVLPNGAARRYLLWLYGLSVSNRSTVIVLPQPPSKGNMAEGTVPLLVWRLKEELDFGYLFLTSGSKTLVALRTDPDDNGINLGDFADFIDSDGKTKRGAGKIPAGSGKRDMAVVFPERTSMLPVDLKHLQEGNFGRYLDWLAAALQASGGCVVKTIEKWRKS